MTWIQRKAEKVITCKQKEESKIVFWRIDIIVGETNLAKKKKGTNKLCQEWKWRQQTTNLADIKR